MFEFLAVAAMLCQMNVKCGRCPHRVGPLDREKLMNMHACIDSADKAHSPIPSAERQSWSHPVSAVSDAAHAHNSRHFTSLMHPVPSISYASCPEVLRVFMHARID